MIQPGRLILLPGMIADQGMYARVRCERALTLVPWPRIQPHWGMEDCARAIIARDAITLHDTVGGVSLGGMMGLEIARAVPVRRVVLISSCRRREHISRLLLALAAVAPLLPVRALHRAPLPRLGRADRAILQGILERMDPALLRWSCRALRAWRGVERVRCPIHHLHGASDMIIPLHDPDEVVPGAGHFLCLTHPHRLAAFLDALPD